MNIMQYESKVWSTADSLIGAGIKQSDFPKFMMPFFALVLVESRLLRMKEKLEESGDNLSKDDFLDEMKEEGKGYNIYLFEKGKSLKDICKNDKTFEIDFDAYLKGFDNETRDLLGIDKSNEDEKFLDISNICGQLKKKKIFFAFVSKWAEIDLKPFNNSEITTLEEYIKRKWADISAETAGEQYTPDDVIALMSEIVNAKIEQNNEFLTIYDPSCGGGNLLFGVEDRIKKSTKRPIATYGKDWSDSLYALAKIESRFRENSEIEYGNTLTGSSFYDKDFDVIVANPPHGITWKDFSKDIYNDKSGQYHYTPAVSDGQLLFNQHIISRLSNTGLGVVVHNGSALFSGDAGSGESNIRKESKKEILDTILEFKDNDFAKVFDREYFYFNKQAITLTNVDGSGKGFVTDKKSLKLDVKKIIFKDEVIEEFSITDKENLKEHNDSIKEKLKIFDYKDGLKIETSDGVYFYDSEKETLMKDNQELGCGKIVIKSQYKKGTKTKAEEIVISVELTPDYEKDYEIIPFSENKDKNKQSIDNFMAKYVSKPFEYGDNTIGVEINFNKVFYKPEKLRELKVIIDEIKEQDKELKQLEGDLGL
jgi:type I restriction enzyme M protein